MNIKRKTIIVSDSKSNKRKLFIYEKYANVSIASDKTDVHMLYGGDIVDEYNNKIEVVDFDKGEFLDISTGATLKRI